MATDRLRPPSAPVRPGPYSVPGVQALDRGLAAQQAGHLDEAIRAYRRAVTQNPGLAPAHFNLGQLLRQQGDYAGAALSFEGAARLRPHAADAWLNLGAMLERIERFQDAVAAYQRAVACHPDDPSPTYNLGNTLLSLGDFDGAATAYRTVIDLQPDHADAHWNLATALLASGDYVGGWRQYDWRWTKQGLDPATRCPWPLWKGETVAGKRILVWREQGLGDEILFATCIRELVALGAMVTVAASSRLVSLFARAFPGVEVVADGEWGAGPFDFHCPLGGLPKHLRRTRMAFVGDGKFLVPDSQHATRWATRLDQLGPGLRVGICWRSGLVTEDRARAYSGLDAWAPLFALPGIQWVNLQYDECEAELEAVSAAHGVRVHRWKTEDLKNDLESVVGLLWNLDLVITAPTAVSSLAGATGVATLEIDNGSDWTTHGEDQSPWFPSIHVVRRAFGTTNWRPVLDRVAAQLRSIGAGRAAVE